MRILQQKRINRILFRTMKMNEISKVTLGLVAFILLLGLAGTCDRMDIESYQEESGEMVDSFDAVESAYDAYFYE